MEDPPARGAPKEEDNCQCDKNTWSLSLMIIAMSCMLLQTLAGVLLLMASPSIADGILEIYIAILAVMCFFVELRRFTPFRAMIYSVVKYFYFLTSYPGRSVFYIFLGSISINGDLLSIIAGGSTITIGVLYFVIHCRYGLPRFVDPEVAIAEAEERVRRETEQRFMRLQSQTPNSASGSEPSVASEDEYKPPL